MSDNDPIGGDASLDVWDRRTDTQLYGDAELKIRGPYRQDGDDNDPYLRLSVTIDDCEYDDCGGAFAFSIGMGETEQLVAALQAARERDPMELFEDMADDGGDSA